MNNLSSKILKKIDLKLALKEYSFILIGTFLMAVGFVIFIAPLKLAPGGGTAVSLVPATAEEAKRIKKIK